VYAGTNAISLAGTNAYARQTFNDGQTNVWTELVIQPVFGEAQATPDADSTFAFYVNTSSNVVVFDGTNATAVTAVTLTEGAWVHFLVHSDYTDKTWDLRIDGAAPAAATDLDFYDTNATAYTEFGIMSDGAPGTSHVDNVEIALTTTSTTSTTTTLGTSTTTTQTTTTSTTAGPQPLPFSETFEDLASGTLNGQNAWQALNAEVQTNVVYKGLQSAELSTLTNHMRHVFVGQYNTVWTDMRVKPVFGQPAQPPPGTTFAFFVMTNGVVMAYDGSSPKPMSRVPRRLTEGEWVRFSVESDYVNKKWQFWVNSLHVGFDLAFRDASATTYTEFGAQAGGVSNGHKRSYFDDINIMLDRPDDLNELLLLIY